MQTEEFYRSHRPPSRARVVAECVGLAFGFVCFAWLAFNVIHFWGWYLGLWS